MQTEAAREVRWERMFPDQIEAAFAAKPILYLPYGMCEPHGPQNAPGHPDAAIPDDSRWKAQSTGPLRS